MTTPIPLQRYTLWTRGRLLGETDLGFRRVSATFRAGWLEPTELGLRLMPLMTGVSPSVIAFGRAHDRKEKAGQHVSQRELMRTVEFADMKSAEDELASLELELHDHGGEVVRTELITVLDADVISALVNDMLEDEWQEECADLDGVWDLEEDLRLVELEKDADLAGDTVDDIDIDFDDFDDRPWQPTSDAPLPRYQIQVLLPEADAVA